MTIPLTGVRPPAAFESLRLRTVRPAAASIGQTATADRTIENLALVIFWLLLLEGALRKWVAPEYSLYLFFIRDPFVLLIYWRAFRLNAFRNAGLLFQLGLLFAVVAVFLVLLQSMGAGSPRSLAVATYGWRQYFLYLPLPFALGATLTGESLQRFARHASVAVMLTAPLVILQSVTSPSAILNRGIAEDASLQFQSFAFTAGRIRPSGTFTSNVGVAQLIASTFALVLAAWLLPAAQRKMRVPWLLVASAATGACLAVCGSRAAFAQVALVLMASMLLGLTTSATSTRVRALFVPLALASAGAVLYPIVFPEALGLMLNRVAEAAASAGSAGSATFGRAFHETVDFVNFMSHTPLAGYGLGMGGNGRTYLNNIDPDLLARASAESDWSRHIVDLGIVVGPLLIVYRIICTIALFIASLRATRTSASPFPILLFGFVGIGLFYGQLTGHGTVGGFLWLFVGLCMASCRAVEPSP